MIVKHLRDQQTLKIYNKKLATKLGVLYFHGHKIKHIGIGEKIFFSFIISFLYFDQFKRRKKKLICGGNYFGWMDGWMDETFYLTKAYI